MNFIRAIIPLLFILAAFLIAGYLYFGLILPARKRATGNTSEPEELDTTEEPDGSVETEDTHEETVFSDTVSDTQQTRYELHKKEWFDTYVKARGMNKLSSKPYRRLADKASQNKEAVNLTDVTLLGVSMAFVKKLDEHNNTNPVNSDTKQ